MPAPEKFLPLVRLIIILSISVALWGLIALLVAISLEVM